MKVNPADQPKVIGLIAAIVLIGGYGAFRLVSNKPAGSTPPASTPVEPGANLPTAAMLADGKYQAGPATAGNQELATAFQGPGSPMAATINPFRSPVPKAPQAASTNPPASPPPGVSNSMPPSQIRGGGFAPMPIGGPEAKGGPSIEASSPMLVKGIIVSEGSVNGLAFIGVGDNVKGYRVGDTLSPGIKIVAITTGKVTVRIGKREIEASVGKELKFLD